MTTIGPRSDTDTAHPLSVPGTILAGRFEVQGLAGLPGTTAFALRAIDLITTEPVVCKLPKLTVADGRKLLLSQYWRMREIWIRALAFPIGFFEHDDPTLGKVPVLVLEWVDGPTLKKWASEENSSAARAAVLEQVASALAALHGQHARHGDVDSLNVIIRDGRAVLIDPEADLYGATQAPPAEYRSSNPKDDLAGLATLVEELLPEQAARSLQAVLAALKRDDQRPHAFEVADLLRGISEALRSKIDTAAAPLGDRVRSADARHSKVFDAIAAGRTTQLNLLSDRLDDILSREHLSTTKTKSLLDGMSRASGSDGYLPGFNLSCSLSERDSFYLQVHEAANFPKPFPYAENSAHVGKGSWGVKRDGLAALQDTLILVYHRGAVRLLNRERRWPFQEQALDDDWLARCLHVLAGVTTPGLLAPGSFGPDQGEAQLHFPWHPLRQGEGEIPVAGAPPMIVDSEWLTAATLYALYSSAYGRADGNDSLRMIWEGPRQRRIPVVQALAKQFAGRFRSLLHSLNRFDVVHVDETARHIVVEIELTPSFEFRSQPLRFELYAGMLAPPEPARPAEPRRGSLQRLASRFRRRAPRRPR